MSNWTTESTHPAIGCDACTDAIAAAVDMAIVTGSTGATHADGVHVARVERAGDLPETVDYVVRVYVARTWATGALRGTGTREFTITEAPTILGAARAIDAAVERCNGLALLDVKSPGIEPNPAALRWPLGSTCTHPDPDADPVYADGDRSCQTCGARYGVAR